MGVLSRIRSFGAPRTPQAIEQALSQAGMDAQAPFGPGRPLSPYDGYSRRPRSMDYPAGVNTATRGREAWGRPSFATLKGIIDAYDVARMCINHKIDELRSMEPLFVPLDGRSGDLTEALDAARKVLAFPDRDLPYDAWLSKWLESCLRYDAGSLYRRRNRFGDVIGLESLDGSTIFPYVDEHGRRPTAPEPAFQQVVHGQVWNWYTAQDIDYTLFRPQSDSPYGLAPMESILLTANTDIRFQWWFLQAFTEGNMPEAFGEVPPDMSSADKVAEFQDYWDAIMEGDQAGQHKVKWVPNGSKITPVRDNKFNADFPEYLMRRTAAAYGVIPQDLGLVKDVNRANGETQTDVQFRVNTLPWVRFVEGTLSRYLQFDVGLPVKVNLDTGRDKEDRLAEAQAWDIYIKAGMASVDEGRQELLGLPIDNERPVPRFIFSTRTGPVPLTSVMSIAGKIDPETAAPAEDAPLVNVPYEGAEGVLADKAPGGAEFKRAPIDPDEPRRPDLEHPVPGSETAGTKLAQQPLAKDMTGGVTSATGIVGNPMAGDKTTDDDEDELARASELAAFRRFTKARVRDGRWRNFTFTTLTGRQGVEANRQARALLRKAQNTPSVAGLAVVAADTGRVLMLQRALDPDDPAGGMWEFPGGHVEDGEDTLEAAVREWSEETGCPPVTGPITGGWTSANGIYRGTVLTVDSESAVAINPDVPHTQNPDDPDGDLVETVAWMDPTHLPGNPAVRAELAADLEFVLPALGVEQVTKAARPKGDGWQDHPLRQAEPKILTYHAPKVQEALVGSVSDAQLRAGITAYLGG